MTYAKSIGVLQLILGLLFSLQAYAFKLTPIEAEFTPGRQSVQLFKVENSSTQPVAIEISVHRRAMASDGSDQLTPAPDDFAVFPDQIVLEPGASQSVRVQWAGDALPEVEQAYRLVAEQLAIDVDPSQAERSGLRLLVKYLASLYVRPADPAAALIANVDVLKVAEVPTLQVAIRNDGNAHAILRSTMVELQRDGKLIEWTAEQREAIDGKNVLAGMQRELQLPWSTALGEGSDASLEIALREPPAEQP